jgi:hypothetical protein
MVVQDAFFASTVACSYSKELIFDWISAFLSRSPAAFFQGVDFGLSDGFRRKAADNHVQYRQHHNDRHDSGENPYESLLCQCHHPYRGSDLKPLHVRSV